MLGQADLDDLLSERERLNQQLQQIIDQQTDPWGIKVSSVEVKHVDLPHEMQRAMATPGRGRAREARQDHSRRGRAHASDSWRRRRRSSPSQPLAITLRYLQTLTEIAAEKNSTIIFPLPIELLQMIKQRQ